MSKTTPILPAASIQRTRLADGLLTATATLTFAVTGIGLFEGHVTYPSWYNLIAIDDFAAYHADFGKRLIPWLPVPLLAATALNALLIRWCPTRVPRGLVVATFAAQLAICGVTAAMALPLQAQLDAPGHSPDEIAELLDRLSRVSVLRDVPGIGVAAAFVWMLQRQLAGSDRVERNRTLRRR
jgi:hypothetical protein